MLAIRTLLTITISMCIGCLYCQKNDYVWLSGYMGNDSGFVGYSTQWGFYFGTTKLDFSYSPRAISFDTTKRMNFSGTNTCFSDSAGNLLFYTNGIYIANALDEKIENSDSLNAGYFQYQWAPKAQLYGYRIAQGTICIPDGNDYYYLLHSLIDTEDNLLRFKKLLLTELDLSENAGHGKVIAKNQPLLIDTVFPHLSAVKHGNGKDWWLLINEQGTNCFYRLLIGKSGVSVMPDKICTGPSHAVDDVGATCFSPDGGKYVVFNHNPGATLYDFDRCTGELSNPINLNISTNANLGMGLAFSPNGRFLYVSYTAYLFQLDLHAVDIPGSIDTVGVYDGTNAPGPAVFHTAQMGPDGKIYISCGNADTVYHVIERPDEKGDSCLFNQHSLSIPSPSFGVPNFPNYRLGTLPGSPCDTLTGLDDEARTERERIIKVHPNPATDYVIVDYGFTDWNKGDVTLEIVSSAGQLQYQQQLPLYSGLQKVAVTDFSTGAYTVYLKRNHQVIATTRFVKE